MASQEFLASFAVEIDEAGVSRLQEILTSNMEMADSLAAAFGSDSSAIRSFTDALGELPGFSSAGMVTEGFSGLGGLTLGLNTAAAEKDLQTFTALLKKPVSLSANASGIVSAARSAYNSISAMFAQPISVRAKVETEVAGGDSATGSETLRMSVGGRFTKPTDVQVAEDGDAEYIIPVKKEDRAVPLLRQLLGELSPAARESLTGGGAFSLLSGGAAAGQPSAAQITQNNSNVSAPVNIHVHASGASVEEIGQSLYDTAERYLLRTLKGVMV